MPVSRRTGSPYWWYSFTVGSRRFRGSTGRTTKREAEEVEREERHKIEKAQGRGADWTLLAVLNAYWSDHAKFKRSAYMIEDHIAELQEGLGGSTIASRLTAVELHEYRAKRRGNGCQAHTVNRDFAYLRAALEHCKHLGAQMPAIDWKRLKADEPPGRIRFLSTEEYDALMAAAHKELRPIILCAVSTGLRLGDIQRLDWQHVKLEDRLIQIRRTKANKALSVRISPALMAALSTVAVEKRKGRPFVWTGFRRRWAKALKDAKIEDFRFHDLRHTFASWARQAGADIADIAEALGHASITMTMRYAHIKPDEHTTAFDRVSERILRSRGTIPDTADG